jgi:hypothetical protein
METEKKHLLGLLFILIVSCSVRIHFLSIPVHFDEALTFLKFVSKPSYIGLSSYTSTNNHLFHTFLAHLAYVLLGAKPWMIRLPALVAGILLVPMSYVATRMLYENKNAALLTAALVGGSSSLIRYSVQSRGHSIICLIFLTTLAIAAHLRKHPDSSLWILFSVLSALGFYTVPIMLYPYGLIILWFLLNMFTEEKGQAYIPQLELLLKSILFSGVLIFLFYLPVLIVSGGKSLTESREALPRPWPQVIALQKENIPITWMDWNKDMPFWVSVVLVAGFVLSIIFHRRIARHRVPLVVPAFLWVVPILAILRLIPPARVWLFLLTIYLMMASAGLAYGLDFPAAGFKKARSIIPLAFAGALSLLLCWTVLRTECLYEPVSTIWEGEEITCFLKDYLETGDVVVAPSVNSVMKYYFIVHGLSPDYIGADPTQKFKNRIIYIADEGRERLDVALGKKGISVQQALEHFFPDYDHLKLLKRYKYSTVYQLDRIR